MTQDQMRERLAQDVAKYRKRRKIQHIPMGVMAAGEEKPGREQRKRYAAQAKQEKRKAERRGAVLHKAKSKAKKRWASLMQDERVLEERRKKSPGRNAKLTMYERKEIRGMIKKGVLTGRDIAEVTGVSRATIRRLGKGSETTEHERRWKEVSESREVAELRKNLPRNRKLTEPEMKEIEKMLESDLPRISIGEIAGVSVCTVNRILSRMREEQ